MRILITAIVTAIIVSALFILTLRYRPTWVARVMFDENGFPKIKKDGDVFVNNGITYTYNNGVWTTNEGGSGPGDSGSGQRQMFGTDYCKLYGDDGCDLETVQTEHCKRLGNLCAGQSRNSCPDWSLKSATTIPNGNLCFTSEIANGQFTDCPKCIRYNGQTYTFAGNNGVAGQCCFRLVKGSI